MITRKFTITPIQLWTMPPSNFNEWRRKNDLPEILKYIQANVRGFNDWQKEFKISDADVLSFTISEFLLGTIRKYIYRTLEGDRTVELVTENELTDYKIQKFSITVKEKKEFVPFIQWATINRIKIHETASNNNIKVNKKQEQNDKEVQAYVLGDVELLWLGNITLSENFIFGNRNLEFCCLDFINIIKPFANHEVKICFSSASNISIEGDMPFVKLFNTDLVNCNLKNGVYHDWEVQNSRVTGTITKSNLYRWKVYHPEFNPLMEMSNLTDCTFAFNPLFSSHVKHEHDTYSYLKRTYSSIGKYNEAGRYYYLEKLTEMKMLTDCIFFHSIGVKSFNGTYKDLRRQYKVGDITKDEFKKRRHMYISDRLKIIFQPKLWHQIMNYKRKLIFNIINYLIWGYGERPFRTIYLSLGLIILFSILYFFIPDSATQSDLVSSFYFSSVTFTTLGYGDLTPKTDLLKILASLEAIFGAISIGFIVAGLSSKNRY